ncbi:TolC family protein [Desulfuromonas sp. KJ2020]|uniref:TolC family protein n=1 Tax=Desulfuromonas sp. KJ2020 TaxID=2919173 RepID=UPI0020A81E14|nr:TolC family protein [Desulfuromonas sp. KJ2020]MCP3176216.1 TolC family protein [Desulfuromonas sp. KJ2020]
MATWVNRQLLTGMVLFLLLLGTRAWGTDPPAPDLPALVQEAVSRNPSIEASEAQWQTFLAKAQQAGSFDDPMLMLGINNGLVNDPFAFDQDGMTSKVIGLSQKLPFFGKRALAREAASLEAVSAQARHEERKLALAALVKEVYARLFLVDKAQDILTRNLQVMETVIRAAETRYGVGEGRQQDVLRAQVERSRLLEAQIGLDQQRRSLQANLNRLLARPADTPIGPIADLDTPPVPYGADELRRLAEEKRPLLAGLTAQIDKGKAEEALAQKAFYPDFTLSLEYMQREPAMGGEGDDMYSAAVSFNLPVWRERRQARVAEAQAQKATAQAELHDLRNAIDGGIADLLAKLDRAGRLLDLYRGGILPQSTHAFESAQIAYSNNQVDFSRMLNSLTTLFNDERQLYQTMADYRLNLAQLEALVGTDLTK